MPEDWVGSTTTLFGEESVGLSVLPDGRRLRDAVAADPLHWLGADHLARYGADTMLLVKLLDAGERLPVHIHPLREFAHPHLDRQHGKAEAWCILDGGEVHLGFRREVSEVELDRWVAEQDTEAMLEAMHVIAVRPATPCTFRPGSRTPSVTACSSSRFRSRKTCRSSSSGRASRSTEKSKATWVSGSSGR